MEQLNTAQQILESLHIPFAVGPKLANAGKNAKASKSGPGRFHQPGTGSEKPTRAYRALMTHFAGKRISKPGNKRGLGLV